MSHLRSTLPYFRPYRRGLWVGIVLVAVSNVFTVIAPWLLRLAIDALESPDVTGQVVLRYALLIVAAAFLGGAARFGMRQLLNSISRRIECDLREDFFRHLLRMDASFYERYRTGDIMSRATNDTLAVRQAVGPAVMYSVNTAVLSVFALGLMIWISPRLTLLALVPMLFLPPLVLTFGRIIHRRFQRIQEQFSTLSTMVQENLTGVRLVRAFGQERDQKREFAGLNQEYVDRNMNLIRAAGAFHPSMALLTGLAMVVVLWIGGGEVMADRISVGDFVAFTFYLNLLTWPMIAMGWVVNLFQRGEASMGRINEILRIEPPLEAGRGREPARKIAGRVDFRDVSFRYPGTERPVLEKVSFRVEPGETVAVVGPTGSGKSTLLSLLPRIYDPDEGEILLDGVPLRELDPGRIRATVGMVPQDAFLFTETIQDNIALGLPDDVQASPEEIGGTAGAPLTGDRSPEESRTGAGAPSAEDRPLEGIGAREQASTAGDGRRSAPGVPQAIVQAARTAQLDEQIRDFPRGYHTYLGERGINLSGGQKQRATLARALARDPRILLLDDALSAVDTRTEARILEELRGARKGRTTFIVSHRVSAVMDADHIVVLDEGRVVEEGRHEELMARGGVYARLLRRQLLEQRLEDDLAESEATRAE